MNVKVPREVFARLSYRAINIFMHGLNLLIDTVSLVTFLQNIDDSMIHSHNPHVTGSSRETTCTLKMTIKLDDQRI